MTRGTPSFGKHSKGKTHIRCRRCGRHSYHTNKKRCAFCGFGADKKIRHYNWIRRQS
ncbi:MAG TPA: 50S ribosomal protein L37e [Nitrososphaerales archaeon]